MSYGAFMSVSWLREHEHGHEPAPVPRHNAVESEGFLSTEAVIFIPFSSHVISCVTGAAVHGQGWSLGPKRRPVRKETESCVGILRVRTKSGFVGLGNWGQSTRKGIIGVYYLIDTNHDPLD